MSVVGDNLRRIRTSKSHSQTWVGAALGHNTGSYISAIERGVKHPSPDVISKIETRLGVPSGTLLENTRLPLRKKPGELQA